MISIQTSVPAIEKSVVRFDHDVIAGWISPGEKVLDLGCGDGVLLKRLQLEKNILGYGVENDPQDVITCIKNGVNVIQIDLEKGLAGFEDRFFDRVVMSLSLQTVHHTERVLAEMLRVGREAVVSFPNFGYKTHREAIQSGRMPVSESLPYEWYNSPNVRFFTLADFEILCEQHKIAILECVAFADGQRVVDDPNLNADLIMLRLASA